jgi:glycine dehydrogenase
MPLRLDPPDLFVSRHIGPDEADVAHMLKVLEVGSLDELIDQTVPASIRMSQPLRILPGVTEHALLQELQSIAGKNSIWKSFLGMGYSDCITPPVILRNILQSPGWYTQYTPYQAEISQGRLEALLNFQQMVIDLTGMEVANASLLDEATAAAEAMTMCFGLKGHDVARPFFVADHCHPQTIEIVKTRAQPLGIEVLVGDPQMIDWKRQPFALLLQVPASDGALHDIRPLVERAHGEGALVVVAADIMSLAMVTPPGELGADVAVGSTQRFGVPLGYGGPHAAFFATKHEFVRKMPGRIIGVSKDAHGKVALRMALQTREQHIRREKATSNICTAQVLLAVIAGMYAVYHGPDGIRRTAERIHALTAVLWRALSKMKIRVRYEQFFDTLRIEGEPAEVAEWLATAEALSMNFRRIDERSVGISLDETTETEDLTGILSCFAIDVSAPRVSDLMNDVEPCIPEALRRKSKYLEHPVFNTHHSETEMLRYMKKLEGRDLSLTQSMIPLGSCTMKLNATTEMIPVTWHAFNRIHPFAPVKQTHGYQGIFKQLQDMLADITGMPGVSLQPNAGSQGEYAGLLVIRRYHQSRGQGKRDVCLIPSSAHGTNPASAVMAGMKVVVVKCDDHGNVDLGDLEARATEHGERLAALMVTYPSTHGVFEEDIKRICEIVHAHGGQVYMDGANMNAQVGLCRPGEFGADVCHLNLHKTFCIPHGGGGPGMGPITVGAHLQPFLPRHPVIETGGPEGIGAISAAPWGSASILLISWAYIRLMGGDGLTHATKIAILNANYVARRLGPHFPVYYQGKRGRVAHECILDMRHLRKTAGVDVEDVAKRLMDYGYHAPTMSFPIPHTMMIEPTESESRTELDRFCEAMIAIRNEVREIEEGKQPRDNNVLTNAPHTAEVVTRDTWDKPYTRERAAFPAPWTRGHKFWPAVGRVDNVHGDRKLFCSCPPIEDFVDAGP